MFICWASKDSQSKIPLVHVKKKGKQDGSKCRSNSFFILLRLCLVFIFGSELVHILLKMSSAKNVILGLLLVIERNQKELKVLCYETKTRDLFSLLCGLKR